MYCDYSIHLTFYGILTSLAGVTDSICEQEREVMCKDMSLPHFLSTPFSHSITVLRPQWLNVGH